MHYEASAHNVTSVDCHKTKNWDNNGKVHWRGEENFFLVKDEYSIGPGWVEEPYSKWDHCWVHVDHQNWCKVGKGVQRHQVIGSGQTVGKDRPRPGEIKRGGIESGVEGGWVGTERKEGEGGWIEDGTLDQFLWRDFW